MARGVQDIPAHRIPAQWDPKWFAKWIREVLVNVDIRNAIEGPGIQITGQPDTPATLTASADVLALINQPYVLATSSAFLPNERILAGQSGIVSVTDGGAGANITVGLELGGITPIYLEQEPGWSVMGRVPNATGYLQPIPAALDGDVLRVAGDFLGFGDIVLRASNFANPSAAVGLTAVNGSAITAMRSDGAPALDVSISPTWSGTHTFSITPVVPNDSWTYAKIQNVSATSRFLGRITSGAGDIEELTGTQATTLLDAFTSALKGLAPASGGGTANFLRADGSWAAPGGAAGANPSASVGLAAVNGSATTFLRSDGAPALDQGIAPRWTGAHTFTATTVFENNDPRVRVYQPDGATDGKWWQLYSAGTDSGIEMLNDALNNGSTVMSWLRSGLTLSSVTYGNSTNNPQHSVYGGMHLYAGTTTNGFVLDKIGGSASRLQVFIGTGAGGFIADEVYYNGNNTDHHFINTVGSVESLHLTYQGVVFLPSIHNNSAGASGTIPMAASGTYTPTITLVSGGSSSTARVCQWMRVGNVVTVSGSVSITETVATMRVGISLPIASALTQTWQCGGFIGTGNLRFGTISGDATNDRAEGTWTGISATEEFSFTFTYLVL